MAPRSRQQGARCSRILPDRCRTLVAILSSGFLGQPDICRVLGAQRGQKPIGISTLRKCFAREISGGEAHVKATAVRGFYEALKARESWAISMAMRNLYGWVKPRATGVSFDLPGRTASWTRCESNSSRRRVGAISKTN